ncbi:FhuF-like iron-sulfur protein [Motilibacter peucedani]|uniref:FhuF-like iron-sulfur protein n=1 Tax=Motilibacter peucedani TaxID=598650 RepID=A0A420XPG7_9ACTN|nr:(2Fe-2S)-binding protein [Motilibacter peucedani]RKS74056.1 FhuF-like iron-sulfur protein [Motilibacter peucedani]
MTGATPTAQLLRELEQLGPFFALETVDAAAAAADQRAWQPLSEMVAAPALLEARVREGRTVVAGLAGVPEHDVERRVVVSVVVQGLVGRLVSPALAALVLHEALPDPSLWQWRPTGTGPLPLRLVLLADRAPFEPVAPPEAADAFAALVLERWVEPLLSQAGEAARLAPSLLRGNAASAVAGAGSVLARARPEHADGVRRLLSALLAVPALAGTGRLEHGAFRRRTCCLYYRVPGGGTCGDCPLSR